MQTAFEISPLKRPHIVAFVSEKTETRVKGVVTYHYMPNMPDKERKFDVKHDGEVFYIGSGSSKRRFRFADMR